MKAFYLVLHACGLCLPVHLHLFTVLISLSCKCFYSSQIICYPLYYHLLQFYVCIDSCTSTGTMFVFTVSIKYLYLQCLFQKDFVFTWAPILLILVNKQG